CILFEATPGRALDRFEDVHTPAEALARAKELLHKAAPWADGVLKDAQLVDPLAWGKGAVTPSIRKPVGRLPSGRPVMGVGDAVVLNDPIAGQGANAAAKMAHFLTARIIDWADRPFTAEWMQAQFDAFWEQDARYITAFSNLLLEPPTLTMIEVLGAASQ